jgi:hypothetical protein
MRIKCGRAVNDPEKLVAPGILYASKSDATLTVHLIAIGWWDWHISFMWTQGYVTPTPAPLEQRDKA